MKANSSAKANAEQMESGEVRLGRPLFRFLLVVFGLLLLGAAGMSWWALDRFVIDHVEIDNVVVHEQQLTGGDVSLSTFPDREVGQP